MGLERISAGALVCLAAMTWWAKAGDSGTNQPAPSLRHRPTTLAEARAWRASRSNGADLASETPPPTADSLEELGRQVSALVVHGWHDLLSQEASRGSTGGRGLLQLVIGDSGALVRMSWLTNTLTVTQATLAEAAVRRTSRFPTLYPSAIQVLGPGPRTVIVELLLADSFGPHIASRQARSPHVTGAVVELPFVWEYPWYGARNPWPWDAWDRDSREGWGPYGPWGPYPYVPRFHP